MESQSGAKLLQKSTIKRKQNTKLSNKSDFLMLNTLLETCGKRRTPSVTRSRWNCLVCIFDIKIIFRDVKSERVEAWKRHTFIQNAGTWWKCCIQSLSRVTEKVKCWKWVLKILWCSRYSWRKSHLKVFRFLFRILFGYDCVVRWHSSRLRSQSVACVLGKLSSKCITYMCTFT